MKKNNKKLLYPAGTWKFLSNQILHLDRMQWEEHSIKAYVLPAPNG